MAKALSAIRHVAFEDLGGFEELLKGAGYSVRYVDVGIDDLAAVGEPNLLAVLGGPIGAYEDNLYPFLRVEATLIASRLRAGKPTLGICLGAQLMARALGARVYPGGAKEIGWKPLTLADAGIGLLAPLTGQAVLHWHGDTFDLPEGATNLASTAVCKHQAFTFGRHAIAFQFHPEAQSGNFDRWLIGHAYEIAATTGVSAPRLRADSLRFSVAAGRAGRNVLQRWLNQLS